MKVIAINGSPNKTGNTYTAIKAVLSELENRNIETEIIHLGNDVFHGCTACGACGELGRCIIESDPLNGITAKMKKADGIILGSPVYYAGISGQLKAFLDRAFFSAGASMRHKVGAAVVAVRRAGAVSAFDELNRYFSISEMLTPSSSYWNMAFGLTPGEAVKDAEGLETMRLLGRNMAWLLEMIDHCRGVVEEPEYTPKTFTNFIR